MKNKRGMTTLQIFFFIFACFFGIVFLGLAIWSFSLVHNVLGIDVMVGQVNLGNATNSTFGQIATAFSDNGDALGIVFMLGMVILMIVNGFFLGSKYPRLFIILDIFILVFAFILAVYISQTYNTLINSSAFFSFYADDLPKSSTFLLNLPIFVSIIGVLIMIVSYAGIKKDPNVEQYGETPTVLGYG